MSGSSEQTAHEEINVLYPNYWPDDWDEDDIEFAAELLQRELNVKLVKRYDPDESEWSLQVPKNAEYYTKAPERLAESDGDDE